MVIILDVKQGEALNFKTRKESAAYLGITAPTLRKWLKEPFFLYRTFIITDIGNGKIERSREALDKVQAIRNRDSGKPPGASPDMEPELFKPKTQTVQ